MYLYIYIHVWIYLSIYVCTTYSFIYLSIYLRIYIPVKAPLRGSHILALLGQRAAWGAAKHDCFMGFNGDEQDRIGFLFWQCRSGLPWKNVPCMDDLYLSNLSKMLMVVVFLVTRRVIEKEEGLCFNIAEAEPNSKTRWTFRKYCNSKSYSFIVAKIYIYMYVYSFSISQLCQ